MRRPQSSLGDAQLTVALQRVRTVLLCMTGVFEHLGRTGLLLLVMVVAGAQVMSGTWPLAWDELLSGRLRAIPTGCPILLQQLRKASRDAGRNGFAWVRKTMWAVPVLYQPG